MKRGPGVCVGRIEVVLMVGQHEVRAAGPFPSAVRRVLPRGIAGRVVFGHRVRVLSPGPEETDATGQARLVPRARLQVEAGPDAAITGPPTLEPMLVTESVSAAP